MIWVTDVDPCEFDLSALDLSVDIHDVLIPYRVDRTFRQLPDLLRDLSVLGDFDKHVGRQTVCEGSDFAGRTACRGLACQRECAAARFCLLAEKEVNHIGLLVYPASSCVLVHTHRPEADHFAALVYIEVAQGLEFFLETLQTLVRIAFRDFRHIVESVRFKSLLELFEADLPVSESVASVLHLHDVAGFVA